MKTLHCIIFSIFFLSACSKFEWHNPYDPECPKELFTPSSLDAAMESNTVKLTWNQQNDHISGFSLFRSADDETITRLTQTQKSTTQYIDANLVPGKKYTYYVLAVAGTNISDTLKTEIIPIFLVSLSTGAVTELSSNSAKVAGNIVSAGGGTVTNRGICWATSPNPTVNNNKTTEGSGLGLFSSILTNLQPGVTYYVRAFGENSRGISYGTQVVFTTNGLPKITTTPVSNITSASATSGGTITSDGGSPITAKGIVWGTTPNPTINLSTKTNEGAGMGSFTSGLSNLSTNMRYYVRSYASNIIGTSYGEEFSFTVGTSNLASLSQGLLAYYPFNGNANDESGNGNSGTVNRATLTSDRFGKNDNAYDFSNTGANITTPLLAPIGKNSRSMSFWFYTNEINNTNDQWIMVGYGEDLEFTNFYASIWPSNSYVGVDIGASYVVYNTNIIGKWHNLMLIYDKSFGSTVANVKTYLDGVLLQDIKMQTANFEINTGNSAKRPFGFGPPNSPIQSLQTFRGKLDDIRIYNRVLNQEEILYLANN